MKFSGGKAFDEEASHEFLGVNNITILSDEFIDLSFHTKVTYFGLNLG